MTPLPAALTIIPPTHKLVGRVSPPGSKSITNRALLLAALAEGTSRLTGALKSKDTVADGRSVAADGRDRRGAGRDLVRRHQHRPADCAPDAPLFLGNAGTATRFLTAAVATVDGTVIVDGDEHMRKRPIAPLVTALRSLGIDAHVPKPVARR